MKREGHLNEIQLFICGNDDRCIDGQDITLTSTEQLFLLTSAHSGTLFESLSAFIYRAKSFDRYFKQALDALQSAAKALFDARL